MSRVLNRPTYEQLIRKRLDTFPIVALIGARQVGKSTLARSIAADAHWFDLERPADLAKFREPALLLEPLRGLVVIDEVHHAPGLFPLLRVLADRPDTTARFLILGSASPELLRQGSESLAGRVAFIPVDGLDLSEVGADAWTTRWLRGGFPRSFLAPDDETSATWREEFVDTFLVRDLPGLGIAVPAVTMRRFWSMLAHWHGQIWNGSEFGRAFGMSDHTVRRYLDVLDGAFMARVLAPWHENISKRQVRAPKVYVRDSGLLLTLLGIADREALLGHPKVGAAWEGFAMGEVIRAQGARPYECFFWATHQGAELDLLIVRGKTRLGFEFKHTATPARTPAMEIALRELRLDSLDVVVPGEGAWPLGERMRAVGIREFA